MPTYVINSIFDEPMKGFHEKKECKQSYKTCTEIISEDSECQTRFCDDIPKLFNEMLKNKKI